MLEITKQIVTTGGPPIRLLDRNIMSRSVYPARRISPATSTIGACPVARQVGLEISGIHTIMEWFILSTVCILRVIHSSICQVLPGAARHDPPLGTKT
jgi:hypothetical protein